MILDNDKFSISENEVQNRYPNLSVVLMPVKVKATYSETIMWMTKINIA